MKQWMKWLGLAVLVALIGGLIPPEAAAGMAFPLIMGATTEVTDIDEAQKIIFSDLHENFVTDTELLDLFETDMNVQTEETTGGRYIETAQYFQLPGATRSIAIGDYLPIPYAPVVQNSKVYLRKHAAVVQMTGDTMRRVRSDIGAYLNYMERALPDVLVRFKDMLDRELIGYGSGARARIAAINGTALTMDRAVGITGWTDPWLQFQDGEYIVASVDADADPLRNAGAGQAAKITNMDPLTDIITVDAVPGAWAVNDYVFGGDASGSSGQIAGTGEDRELMGLAGLVDDGTILPTFQALSRAAYRPWRSIVIDAQTGGFTGEFTEELLEHADNRAFTEGSAKPTVCVVNRGQASRYWQALKGDRQLVNPKAYEGGKGPLFMRLPDRLIPIRVIRKLPSEVGYLLTPEHLRKWMLAGQWDDVTGSIWNRVTDGTGRKDDFYAVYIWYCQTGNVAPNKHVRFQNMLSS